MSREKPQHIRAALQVLEGLRPEQQAEFRKVLPVFAAKAAQLGEDVTEEFLKNHMAKGADHLQDFVKGLRQKPTAEETPLEQYKKIKESLPDGPNGRLNDLRHTIIEIGDINPSLQYLEQAIAKGDLDTVDHCIAEHEGSYDGVLVRASEIGQLKVVKYCVEEQGCDIKSSQALAEALRCGRLNIVKYFFEEKDLNIRVMNDWGLSYAAVYGQLDLIKYSVEEQDCVIWARDNQALRLAIKKGHFDIVKYCVEQGCDVTNLHEDVAEAAGSGYLDVVKYCVEQGCTLNNLDAEEIQQSLNHYDDWVQKHGFCPRGLVDLAPHYFKASVFTDIMPMLAEEGYKDEIAHQYAYHAAGLFGSTNRVLAYLEKWSEASYQPLHNVIQHISLPQEGRFNNSAWADAVLKHGPKMARLVKFADRLPEPLKNGDGSWSYLKTREEVASFAYRNGARHPDLASLCMQNDWDEVDFENALKHIEKYQQSYAANDNQKPGGHIPDVQIDGAEFDKPGYLFYKLPDGDLRGLFLGEMTGCCQHLAGQGAACASHGFLSKYSGFYAIENKGTGEIVGQSWAWRGEDEALVLDSLESLSGHFNVEQWAKLTHKLAVKIFQNAKDITALNIGTGGATPPLGDRRTASPSQPKNYDGYRDSRRQYQIWKR